MGIILFHTAFCPPKQHLWKPASVALSPRPLVPTGCLTRNVSTSTLVLHASILPCHTDPTCLPPPCAPTICHRTPLCNPLLKLPSEKDTPVPDQRWHYQQRKLRQLARGARNVPRCHHRAHLAVSGAEVGLEVVSRRSWHDKPGPSHNRQVFECRPIHPMY